MRSHVSLENDKLKRRVQRMYWRRAIEWTHLSPTLAMQEMASIRDLLVAAETVQRLNASPKLDRRTRNAGAVHVEAALSIVKRLITGMPHTGIHAVLADDIYTRIQRISDDIV